ncbi:hypothetical protein [Pseudomonas brassicacearum]|uniref:hypothetical protein n=1 Tax=Pseudomonas brassicacearum TaxID=930166 RepID=UPI002181FBB5|nr:hypothetical protein [Pseudomonas brassicacearum]
MLLSWLTRFPNEVLIACIQLHRTLTGISLLSRLFKPDVFPHRHTGTGMGILDRLFGGRFTMPPPEETNLSASAIMKELRTERSDPGQKKH